MKLPLQARCTSRQSGASLIVVLLILIVVSILGVGGAQIALLAERGARNDRDMQMAWQAAEAALQDAEFDIHGPGTGNRSAVLGSLQNTNVFVADCGTNVTSGGISTLGLCELAMSGKPAWQKVNFAVTGSNAKTVEFGRFTGRSFAANNTSVPNGIEPFQAPRYVIEPIPDPGERDLSSVNKYVFRVTAMGFGPRDDIQAVTQIIYRN
ncbi:pilus assembly PilX family protein [Variovorax sp. RA8]|uniref:pilus assembly PilX family protein n=1 Tax=Variovorax sp. (strain JCM 16519 / RA8) TaxID=662548 RepID=UPI000AEFF9E1|nr:PilX N-terminal domain-containing pilus assembly protein [Variovorax sp. RA8]VTU26580.1 Tfp pilus assembly protein PilX [Variovorax sp. RA8]